MKRELQRYVVWRCLQLFLLGITLGTIPAAYFLASFWLLVPPVASALALTATIAGLRDAQRYHAFVKSLELVKVPAMLTAQR